MSWTNTVVALMHAPYGEVTLFENMDDALAAAFFMFILFVVGLVVVVAWAVRNFTRRPRWTKKVVVLALGTALLLLTPLVWKNQVEAREGYPARYQAYEDELAVYHQHCPSSFSYNCWFPPEEPDEPVVNVSLYVVLLATGAGCLITGLRTTATDRRPVRRGPVVRE